MIYSCHSYLWKKKLKDQTYQKIIIIIWHSRGNLSSHFNSKILVSQDSLGKKREKEKGYSKPVYMLCLSCRQDKMSLVKPNACANVQHN